MVIPTYTKSFRKAILDRCFQHVIVFGGRGRGSFAFDTNAIVISGFLLLPSLLQVDEICPSDLFPNSDEHLRTAAGDCLPWTRWDVRPSRRVQRRTLGSVGRRGGKEIVAWRGLAEPSRGIASDLRHFFFKKNEDLTVTFR